MCKRTQIMVNDDCYNDFDKEPDTNEDEEFNV